MARPEPGRGRKNGRLGKGDPSGDRAIILWRYRFGPELSRSVRGVNVMHVRDGLIVEALGYVKTGDAPVATAVRDAAS